MTRSTPEALHRCDPVRTKRTPAQECLSDVKQGSPEGLPCKAGLLNPFRRAEGQSLLSGWQHANASPKGSNQTLYAAGCTLFMGTWASKLVPSEAKVCIVYRSVLA